MSSWGERQATMVSDGSRHAPRGRGDLRLGQDDDRRPPGARPGRAPRRARRAATRARLGTGHRHAAARTSRGRDHGRRLGGRRQLLGCARRRVAARHRGDLARLRPRRRDAAGDLAILRAGRHPASTVERQPRAPEGVARPRSPHPLGLAHPRGPARALRGSPRRAMGAPALTCRGAPRACEAPRAARAECDRRTCRRTR